MNNKEIVLDLFCGMGGWSIGFHREGFRCIGLDIVDVGYPYELIKADIQTYTPSFPPAVIVASPPCTEFSGLTVLSWKKGQRGPPEPEKGIKLVKEAKRVIDEAKPRYWILENVWGAIEHITPLLGKPMLLAKPWVLWGNLPPQLLPATPTRRSDEKICHTFEKGRGGNRMDLPEDFPFDPLRSYKRARIPIWLSQVIAKQCAEELKNLYMGLRLVK